MRYQKLFLMFLLTSVLTPALFPQDTFMPKGSFFVGYSSWKDSELPGPHEGFRTSISANVYKMLGIVFDAGAYKRREGWKDPEYSFMAGTRLSLYNRTGLIPFIQVIAGRSYRLDVYGFQFGGGIDIGSTKGIALRIAGSIGRNNEKSSTWWVYGIRIGFVVFIR